MGHLNPKGRIIERLPHRYNGGTEAQGHAGDETKIVAERMESVVPTHRVWGKGSPIRKRQVTEGKQTWQPIHHNSFMVYSKPGPQDPPSYSIPRRIFFLNEGIRIQPNVGLEPCYAHDPTLMSKTASPTGSSCLTDSYGERAFVIDFSLPACVMSSSRT